MRLNDFSKIVFNFPFKVIKDKDGRFIPFTKDIVRNYPELIGSKFSTRTINLFCNNGTDYVPLYKINSLNNKSTPLFDLDKLKSLQEHCKHKPEYTNIWISNKVN